MTITLPPGDGTQPCIDMRDTFDGLTTASQLAAKKICQSLCPFLDECREYALRFDLEGVWGGTSATQRREIKKERGQGAAVRLHRERAALRARIAELDDGTRSIPQIARAAGCTPRHAQYVRSVRRAAARAEGGEAA